jgi:predicted adenine nucleotide alpha hydrolase (AANH) superfamily ATPase
MLKNSIFLHICCGPCATAVIEKLRAQKYDVFGFFYNPNIYPKKEYQMRLNTVKKLSLKMHFPLILGPYHQEEWKKQTQGLEKEPENGLRCKFCYKMRLEFTAAIAKAKGYKLFTTTLTISPHKSTQIINEIGEGVGERYKIKFGPFDFKKQNGFHQSIILSKEYDLYRQSYCGCKYSL